MTALIGGICVGVLWGFWATREIIKSKREIKARIERNKTRNAKLEAIITLHNNGKETVRPEAEGKRQDDDGGGNLEID
jgi:hypothetical protein